jgi:2-hydroxy-3-oxopropionate reductase
MRLVEGDSASPFPSSVGFIGLGVMGRPMAGHILRAALSKQSRLSVFTRTSATAESLLATGATWLDSSRAVGAMCDVLVIMVPDYSDVRDVIFGEKGLLAGVAQRTMVAVCSTMSPDSFRNLALETKRSSGGNLHLIDAPVSGGEIGAVEGSLSIMVGGEADDVNALWQVLQAMGRPGHIGPVGAGQVAKACNQIITSATLLALSEAAILANRSGLDVVKLFSLLEHGLAGSRLLQTVGRRIAAEDYERVSGRAHFIARDVQFAKAEAEHRRIFTRHLKAIDTTFDELVQRGYGEKDLSAIREFLELAHRNTTELRTPPDA